jgi:hypothetical protein
VDHTTRITDQGQQNNIADDRFSQWSEIMAFPPYLTTTVLPLYF